MRVEEAVTVITEAVELEGLLLVHDQRLPSVTALIAGEPVRGSWWAHPLSNVIYNALGELDDRFATCKLVAGKLTLVAPRLWANLVAVGAGRRRWQLDALSGADLALLDRVASAADPILLDRPELRAAGKRLEEKLLVTSEGVHTADGHHLKALTSWEAWASDRRVIGPLPDPDVAAASFEAIVEGWEAGTAALLPWHD